MKLLPLLLFLLTGPALADPGFDAFQQRFRAAVAHGDAPAVAALTRLPFLFEGRRHDAESFARQVWPRLFDARLRRCIAERSAQAEGADRVLFCGAYALYFDAAGGSWKLREFGVDAETN